MKNKPPLVKLPIVTADGEFLAGYTSKGLVTLNFPDAHKGLISDPATTPEMLRWHRVTTTALKNILGGRDADEIPPLDLAGGTEFQRAVWAAMRKIPAGRTRSYGEIAKAIGNPKAVRAVGGACGANPIPVLVPCHRVLAANNRIGGFSSGLDWKRKLLAREGVTAD